MKKFNFRLERVLRLKHQRERQAELRQVHARSQVDAARMQLRIIQDLMRLETSTWATRPAQALTAGMRIAAINYLAQMQRQVEAAESHVRKTELSLLEANNQRAKIHREVESLDFLRRVGWEEHQRDTAQVTQQQLDELSLRRWQLEKLNHGSEPLYDREVTGS